MSDDDKFIGYAAGITCICLQRKSHGEYLLNSEIVLFIMSNARKVVNVFNRKNYINYIQEYSQ